MDDELNYTHWAYFRTDQALEAQTCVSELAKLGFLAAIDPSDGELLLRAAHPVDVAFLGDRHDLVEEIVSRFGGEYDGGEATYLTGEPSDA